MTPDGDYGWRDRFLADPPDLLGGVGLSVERLDGRLRLHLQHGVAKADLRAAFLTVPYASGLQRLLASDPEIEAVVVEHIPSGLDAAAEDAGVSYLDRLGHGRVVAPGFVYVAPPRGPTIQQRLLEGDLPDSPARPRRRSARRVSPFAPKASRITRALLAGPGRAWSLSELAKEVDVDPGNAHRVLGALREMGLVERDDDKYFVPDPGSLLEAWAESTPLPRERIVMPVQGDPREWLLDLIAGRPSRLAVSGELAAELMAPYLGAHQVLLHCLDSDALEFFRFVGEEERHLLQAPARVIAVPADERVGDFGSSVGGLPLVSPSQLYVDLFRERGRARDAAEQVRREVLRF